MSTANIKTILEDDGTVMLPVTSTEAVLNPNSSTVLESRLQGIEGKMQGDWEQDDSGEYDYIKNKPTIPSIIGLAVDSEVVHKTGNETIGGSKTFSSGVTFGYNVDFSAKNVHQHEILVSNTDIATGDDEAILGFEDADSGGYVMLRGVAEPSSNYDAANKKYVDDIVGDIESLLAAI